MRLIEGALDYFDPAKNLNTRRLVSNMSIALLFSRFAVLTNDENENRNCPTDRFSPYCVCRLDKMRFDLILSKFLMACSCVNGAPER